MKAVRANWWTAAVALGICLVLMVVIALLSVRPAADTFLRRPSTFFTDASGTRGIYLVLQRVLPSAEQWRLPITALKQPSSEGVKTLIVMGPGPMGQAEADALDRWIGAGGQLVLAAVGDWPIQGPTTERPPKLFLARHGIPVTPAAGRGIEAAVIKPVGGGRIVYVPDTHAFSNSTLRAGDSTVWLAQRCIEWGGGALFDEYHLGFGIQRGMVSLIASFAITPWGLVSMQLALAGLVYLFGCRRRFGLAIEELPIERTNPIETVQALGGLLRAARARTLSARTIHQYVNGGVSTIVGYRIDLLDEKFREKLAGPLRISKADLDSYAETAAGAMSAKPTSDDELIRFAQQATAIARSFTNGAARKNGSAVAG